MARSTIGVDAEVRAYLLAEAKSFCTLMTRTLLEDGRESGKYAFNALSPRVAAIKAGKAVHLRRFELPPGHRLSAPAAGHPCDSLELGADDVLRPVPSHHPEPVRRSTVL